MAGDVGFDPPPAPPNQIGGEGMKVFYTVTISDDDESEVTVNGMWLTIRPPKEPEVK